MTEFSKSWKWRVILLIASMGFFIYGVTLITTDKVVLGVLDVSLAVLYLFLALWSKVLENGSA